MSFSLKKSFLRHFPAPKTLRMNAVGFEVTPEAVRFIELVDSPHGKKVGRFGEKRLPQSASEEENFLDGERVKRAVMELRDQFKLSLIRAALPEEKIYLFKTEMPADMDSRSIRSGLELRLEENVPLPMKEAVFDFEIAPPTPSDEENRLDVHVSVAPRLVVAKYIEFYKGLGLVPISFEVAAQAAAHACLEAGDTSAVVIVNFGFDKTSLSIVDGGLVHFTSTLEFGGSALTEAIKKQLKVSTVEAEKIKLETGVRKDKQNMELFFSLVSSLSILKDEINKLAAYWQTHQDHPAEGKRGVTRVILCGTEASLDGLADYLAAGLALDVSLANVWANVASIDDHLPPLPFKDSLAFAVPIGLALYHG